MASNKPSYCLNCGLKLDISDKYCPECGQNVDTKVHSIKYLFNDLLTNLFNLENKSFVSFRKLFIPAFLTKAFIRGESVKYLRPFRIFFVSLLILLALQSIIWNKSITGNKFIEDQRYVQQSDIIEYLSAYKDNDSICSNNIREEMAKFIVNDRNLHCEEYLPTYSENILQLNVGSRSLSAYDAIVMDIDELLRKYEFDNPMQKLIFINTFKVYRDQKGFALSALGNCIWIFILLSFLMAICLKLFYLRNHVYFIEHLCLMFHNNALLFVTMSLCSLIVILKLSLWPVLFVPVLFFPFYFFQSIRNYYGQSFIKSSFKSILLLLSYVFLLSIALMFHFFISLTLL